jgi:hypothetical protein
MERGATRRVDKWHENKRRYLTRLETRGIAANLGARRGARWARTPTGVVGVLGASDVGDRWWFGLNEREFDHYHAIGLILLCESGQDLLDFGLPADVVRAFLPRLGSDRRGERKLNVVRRGERYFLQIPGGDPVDLTGRLHDLGWLGDRGDHPSSAEGRRSLPAHVREGESRRFFAQVRHGALKPLDRVKLKEGEIVLVEVMGAMPVPGNLALRRIVAAGGPSALPADFAAQHDVYAHGTQRP